MTSVAQASRSGLLVGALAQPLGHDPLVAADHRHAGVQAAGVELSVGILVLEVDIQTGEYAKSFILETRAGGPALESRRRLNAENQIEVVGEQLRAMMPWIKANKLVDKSKN